MLRASSLLDDIGPETGRVYLDAAGFVAKAPESVPWGDAVVVTSPITDALKEIERDRVGASVDRDNVLAAVGFALSRQVLLALGDRIISPTGLYAEVAALGYEWVVSVEEST